MIKTDIWCVFNETVVNERQLKKIIWLLRDALRHERDIRVIIEHIELEEEE